MGGGGETWKNWVTKLADTQVDCARLAERIRRRRHERDGAVHLQLRRWPRHAPRVRAASPPVFAGPTLIVHGTEEQKQKYLPEILDGDTIWCQGYSEPGSGSDLASLQTRAVRDGDDYVVNGQKIWTSGGHVAKWMILLARTDPDAPKHRGITYFIVDMKSPGLTVRPLINMADSHEFNEVFFEDVRVPEAEHHRRGEPRLVPRADDAELRAVEHRRPPLARARAWKT